MLAPEKEINDLTLRPICTSDLATLFEFQTDPAANKMAAFVVKNPLDRSEFDARWRRMLSDDSIMLRAVELGGRLVGHIGSFNRFGQREVTYWIGRNDWGKGLATQALLAFLNIEATRPLYARTVYDNLASERVLEKCGFVFDRQDTGFANARDTEVIEKIHVLSE